MLKVNQIFCKGCNLCIAICPRKMLEPAAENNPKGVKVPVLVDESKCTLCRYCEVVCPEFALSVYKRREE